MTPSYRIVFYISGHGFGHASRSLEVIRALSQRRRDLTIIVKTSAPRGRFETPPTAGSRLPGPREVADSPTLLVEFMDFQCDTGMVQSDSIHLDAAESIKLATAFHAQLPQKASAEARFLREHDADLVVGDIPPLAFAAAAAAGLPSVAIGNFTWDWIYADYPGTAPELLRTIRDAYAQASLALRLPLAAGFEGLQSITREIPFIARISRHQPAEVRRALGLPGDRPVVLVSFGAYGLRGLNLPQAARLQYTVIPDDFPLNGFEYQDLVRAADVVVTKPGYGIVSECIANDTAILYTSRGHFPEYDVLVREMPKYLRAQFIEQEDLLAGRWGPSLEQLLASPPPAVKPAVNGADVAADEILRMLS